MALEIKTPEHRTWESCDFSVSKAVLEEGQIGLETGPPRFGSLVVVTLDQKWAIDGSLSQGEVDSNQALSKLLHGRPCDESTTLTFRLDLSCFISALIKFHGTY
jgi:hypothetical protein